jgi:hypothetical protein
MEVPSTAATPRNEPSTTTDEIVGAAKLNVVARAEEVCPATTAENARSAPIPTNPVHVALENAVTLQDVEAGNWGKMGKLPSFRLAANNLNNEEWELGPKSDPDTTMVVEPAVSSAALDAGDNVIDRTAGGA